MPIFKFILNVLSSTCCGCGKKANNYPHGIPCCDECNHDVECLSWLGDDCNCRLKESEGG